MLHFHMTSRLLPKHLLKQNPFMRHMLVDDPQPIGPSRNDEAVMQLPERPKFTNIRHRMLDWRVFKSPGRKRPMGIRNL